MHTNSHFIQSLAKYIFKPSQIITKASQNWLQAISRYAQHEISPLAVVKCSTISDIQNSFKLCNQYQVNFVIKSGGVNQANTSIANDSLVIDLSPLKNISSQTNHHNLSLTIQAGVTFKQIEAYLQQINKKNQTGFTIPLAWWRNISCIGAHSTFGNGLTHRMCGLGVDLIKSARVVLWNGQVVDATRHTNSDLLWGIKGCGPSLGCIVEISEQLNEQSCNILDPAGGQQVRNYNCSFPITQQTKTIGKQFAQIFQCLSDNICAQVIMTMNKQSSRTYFMLFEMLYNPKQKCISKHRNEALENQLIKVQSKYQQESNLEIKAKQHNKMQVQPKNNKKRFFLWGGVISNHNLQEFVKQVTNFYLSNSLTDINDDQVAVSMILNYLDGKQFQNRDSLQACLPIEKEQNILIYGNIAFKEKAVEEQCYNYSVNIRQMINKFAKIGSACDFNPRDNTNQKLGKWMYRQNYDRLAEIKKKFDPHNKFNTGLF